MKASSDNKKLSPAAQAKIQELLGQGKSKRRIAAIMGLSDSTVRKYADAFMREPSVSDENEAREKFLELQHNFRKLIGWNGKVTPAKKHPVGKELRITAVGDVHVPAQDDEALAHIVRETKDVTDILVDCGDSADNYNFSRYEKYKRTHSALDELTRLQAYYVNLAETYPEVHIMWGNHDARFIKWLVRLGVPPEALEYLEYCAPGITTNPAARILDGIANVKIVQPIKKDFAEFPFIHQINDVVFSHAERFSKIPNKAVGDVIQWLMSFGLHAGIVKPFRMVVQAHTHQAGTTFNNFGIVGIENGCVTKLPDYAGDSKRLSERVPVIGYTRIYQNDGVTDLARSNFIMVKW